MFKNFSGQVLLSDRRKLKDPIKAIKKLPRGSIFVLRSPLPLIRKSGFNKSLRQLCRRKGIMFFVQNRRLAYQLKSDGIHLKEADRFKPVADLKSRFLISISCHNVFSAKLAEKTKKDFIFYSPIFSTTSHKRVKPLGRLRFNYTTRFLKIPIIALGGINHATKPLLNNLKIKGFAAIDYFS